MICSGPPAPIREDPAAGQRTAIFVSRILLLGGSLGLALGPAPASGWHTEERQAPRPRVLWVSWDGAAADLVHPLLDAGKLPNLAALAGAGAWAEYSESVYPTRTAPAFATLWTGAPPSVHGITGNSVPPPGGHVNAVVNGYSGKLLVAEPIWTTVARQGRIAIGLEPTQSHPLSLYGPGGRFGGAFSPRQKLATVYADRPLREATLADEGELAGTFANGRFDTTSADMTSAPAPPAEIVRLGATAHAWRWPLWGAGDPPAGATHDLWVWVYDEPGVSDSGLDAVMVTPHDDGSDAVRVPVRPAEPGLHQPALQAIAAGFVGVPVQTGVDSLTVYLRCWDLHPSGPPDCYRLGASRSISNDDALATELEAAAPGGAGNGGSIAYRRGLLGPPLWRGGDGRAEARYAEIAAFVIGHMGARFRAVGRRSDWDMLITYFPFPDEAMHLWWGFVEPRSRAYDPPLAARLRPIFELLMGWLDEFLGDLRRVAGDGVTTLLTTDHGYMAVSRAYRPNQTLRRAGLLAVREGPNGTEFDLTGTRAIYHPGNNAFFLVNSTDRLGGIVTPEDRSAVLDAVRQALLEVRDPDTGEPVVARLWSPEERPGLGGPNGGDLYLDLMPGYDTSSDLLGPEIGPRTPAGDHRFDPRRPDLRGVFFIAGPSVAPGSRLERIRNLDVAPTVCAILGIQPPANATGEPIAKLVEVR